MKKLTLLTWLLLFVLGMAAQSLPTDGRIVYFDFDGSVADKTTGKKLQRVKEDYALEKVASPRFVDTPDGGKAFLLDGVYAFEHRMDLHRYPELTVVMRVKVDSIKESTQNFFVVQKKPQKNSIDMSSQRRISINSHGQIQMNGYATYDSEDNQHVRSEDSLKNKFVTLIHTFEKDSMSQYVVMDDKIYHYYNRWKHVADKWYEYFTVGDKNVAAELDYLAIYNRELTQQEMAAIVGKDLTPMPFVEEEDEPTGFLVLGLLSLVFPAIVLVFYWKRRRYPEITPEYLQKRRAAAGGNGSREETLAHLEAAKSHWTWELNKFGGLGDVRYPKSRLGFWKSRKAFDKALGAGCEDEDVVKELNLFAKVYNLGQKYSFRGFAILPILCFLGYLGMFVVIQGGHSGDSYGVRFLHALTDIKAMGFYLLFISYYGVCYCPNYVCRRGQQVDLRASEKSRFMKFSWEELKEGATSFGGVLAAIFAILGAVAMAGLHFFGEVLKNSTEVFKVFRNGHYVGTVTKMSATGIGMAFFVFAIVVFIFVIFSFVLTFATLIITPVRFVINHIIRW